MGNVINVPGKILFLGGYSVLEDGHPSLSLAVVDGDGKGVIASVKENKKDVLIAKQFGIEKNISLDNFEKENVATTAFLITKLYLEEKGYANNFKVELNNSPAFGIKNKAGLGSSAAAIVGVVKSLFAANDIDLDAHLETIHKLAQYSYSVYSGKIGSGFDIATCSKGCTITYKRFHPSAIELPSSFDDRKTVVKSLLNSIEKPWDGLSIKRFTIPEKYYTLFFDIEGGQTSTISNVKAVMQWRKQNEKEYLNLINKQKDYEIKAIDALLKGDNAGLRLQVHKAREIHTTLQELVKASIPDFNPIEPEPLSKIIGIGESLPGIVGGRCPGAGGWDGLVFIIDKEYFVESDIEQIINVGKEFNLKMNHIPLRLL